jgi:ABC-type bacteriocin transporter
MQHDETDCAAACLATICHYYGKRIPINRIRTYAGTDTKGTSGLGIIEAAKKLGFLVKGAKVPDIKENVEIPSPFIAHVKREIIDHFVVVYKITDKQVVVGDPATGYEKMSRAEFNEQWTGVFFVMYPEQKFEKNKETRNLFDRFFYLVKPYGALLREVFLASLVLTILGVVGAFYYRFLIDEVLSSGLPTALLTMGIGMALIIIFQVLLGLSRTQLIISMSNKIDAALTFQYFGHVLKLPLDFFSKRKTGEILSRLNDVARIRQAISGTTLTILLDTMMLLIGGIFLFLFSFDLVFIAMIPVLLSTVVVWIYTKPYRKMIKEKAVTDAKKQSLFVESFNGISTIKALSSEEQIFLKAEGNIVESINQGLNIGFWGNVQSSIQGFLSKAGTLAVFWIGSMFILDGKMTLGELISFNTLLGYFVSPLSRLITLQPSLQEAFVSSDRLGEIIDLPLEDEKEEGAAELTEVKGDIEIKDLSFSYGTRGDTIKNVSLKINAGEKIAFVGPSGSGKSTLVKLILKFFLFERGEITLDGQNLKDIKTYSLRSNIGYVPQEILLFSGTILENIALGSKRVSQQEILKASIAAKAHDFIAALPERYNTGVGERGATLSGGERQRIALARMILRNPKILILDEATSSLDSVSEKDIMTTIDALSKKRTTIIVAHRLSTIQNCDRIFVVEKGGNHREGAAQRTPCC